MRRAQACGPCVTLGAPIVRRRRGGLTLQIPLVVAGHSHGHALGIPVRAATEPIQLTPLDLDGASFVALAGPPQRDGVYWDALVHAAAKRVAAIAWNGNQHYAYFMFAPEPPFDFVLSTHPRLPIDRAVPLVPESMIRAFMAPSLDPLDALLARLRSNSAYPAIVVGTPPPRNDVDRIRERLSHEPHFLDWAEKLGKTAETVAISPPLLMAKLWRLVQMMTCDVTKKHGATFVPVGEHLLSDESYLPEPFWSADATHANGDFGREMMRDVIRAAAALAAPTGKVA